MSQTIPPSYAQASAHQQLRYARFICLLQNEPFQQTLLNRITDPLDKNLLSNTHELLGLREIHTDAVARIDFLLGMNANRLVQQNMDRLFDDLYPVLQPDTLHPTMPSTISSSPSWHFSPINNPKQSSSTPAAPRCISRKKAPNPYPIQSPSIEQTLASWVPQISKKGITPYSSTSAQTKPPHDTPPRWCILTPPIFNYTPAWDADDDPYNDENCCEWIDNYLDKEAKHNLAT